QGLDREPTEHLGPSATALERKERRTDRGDRNRDVAARNRTAEGLRRDYSDTAERLERAAPRVDAPIDKLIAEATRVRAQMLVDREAWSREREALTKPPVPSAQALERQFLREDFAGRTRAQAALRLTEARVGTVRRRRLELVAWIRNPARMIWAKHAELNAIARARKAAREAELRYALRQAWLRTPQGRAAVSARRQPDLNRAADAARKRRTLERKIKRIDRRIATATRTLNDLVVAEELGERSFKVPAQSPDATRFLRSVGEPARAAVQRHPLPARQQALERLNKVRGRQLGQRLFPSP
ncbi:MAG TPA: MobA/MobL protein, partial [Caulobacteraceae bacterium]|nr:MobA/MobL protein [Caulobacteraceae bacterium]